MTRRQLVQLFDETVLGEPPLRDLVGEAVIRGRTQQRRSWGVTAGLLVAAAVAALVVLPEHGPWRQSLSPVPAVQQGPAQPLPDRFLPVPQVPEDAAPVDGAVRIGDPWSAERAVDPYDTARSAAWASDEGGAVQESPGDGTALAIAVDRLVTGAFVHSPAESGLAGAAGGTAIDSGVALGFDGPANANLDGSSPTQWVETWLSDADGRVTGLWVQRWTLWPSVWRYCTDADAECVTTTVDGVTVASARTRIEDPVTREPVTAWTARARTADDLMVVVVAGPRTRAGVSVGPARPQPLLDRGGVEQLARDVVALGPSGR